MILIGPVNYDERLINQEEVDEIEEETLDEEIIDGDLEVNQSE